MCGREERGERREESVCVPLKLAAVTQALDSSWGVFVCLCLCAYVSIRQHTEPCKLLSGGVTRQTSLHTQTTT
jgi:hypothetical protein